MTPVLARLCSLFGLIAFGAVCSFGLWVAGLALVGRDVRCVVVGHRWDAIRIAYPVPVVMRCERCRARVQCDEVMR